VEKTVEKVARKVGGSAGLGEVSSTFLKQVLLWHGNASRRLRKRWLILLSGWPILTILGQATYQAQRMGRLIALDKCPGVRPVRISEIWSRLIAKVILVKAGQEVKKKPVETISSVPG
jgi:hypothetical protein